MTQPKSETPRTDRAAYVPVDPTYSTTTGVRTKVVSADFARQLLERECEALRADAERYRCKREEDWDKYVSSLSWYPPSASERHAWVLSYDAAIDEARSKGGANG